MKEQATKTPKKKHKYDLPIFKSVKHLLWWLKNDTQGQAIVNELRTGEPSELLDRLPPCNREAEMALVGSVLLEPKMLKPVASIVTAEDFYCEETKRVFAAIARLYYPTDANGCPATGVDIVILRDHLIATGEYSMIGGAPFLAEIAQSVPVAYNAEYYARIVKRHALLRQLIKAATETLREAWTRQVEPRDVAYQARAKLAKIMDANGKVHEANGKAP